MVKKLSIFISTLLFAQTQFYTYTVIMDYKEYVNGAVIDKDTTNFGELNGIGVEYTKKDRINLKLKMEFAYGTSTYDGATWGGTPVTNKQDDVYIFNAEAMVGKIFYIGLGYRLWNRGTSSNPGDYNEKYYWPYFAIKYDYPFVTKNFAFVPSITYQTALSPKMKVELGNNPVLDLGATDGYNINLPLYFKTKKVVWYLFYRYQYWHISKSDDAVLKVGNTINVIYEPESETRNQYIGAGIVLNF